jgi:hypothetical protein
MSSSRAPLNEREKKVLHFIGDETFPFSENLMKIFPGQHPKGSNVPLHDLQSPQSCRKFIWPRVFSFLSAS